MTLTRGRETPHPRGQQGTLTVHGASGARSDSAVSGLGQHCAEHCSGPTRPRPPTRHESSKCCQETPPARGQECPSEYKHTQHPKGEIHNVQHPIKNYQTCKEAGKCDP